MQLVRYCFLNVSSIGLWLSVWLHQRIAKLYLKSDLKSTFSPLLLSTEYDTCVNHV